MSYDYCKLKGKIREKYKTQSEFAEELDISATSLSYKLNNKIPFTQDEISEMKDIFKLKDKEVMDYFFTPLVEKKSTKQ